MGSFNKKTAPF